MPPAATSVPLGHLLYLCHHCCLPTTYLPTQPPATFRLLYHTLPPRYRLAATPCPTVTPPSRITPPSSPHHAYLTRTSSVLIAWRYSPYRISPTCRAAGWRFAMRHCCHSTFKGAASRAAALPRHTAPLRMPQEGGGAGAGPPAGLTRRRAPTPLPASSMAGLRSPPHCHRVTGCHLHPTLYLPAGDMPAPSAHTKTWLHRRAVEHGGGKRQVQPEEGRRRRQPSSSLPPYKLPAISCHAATSYAATRGML